MLDDETQIEAVIEAEPEEVIAEDIEAELEDEITITIEGFEPEAVAEETPTNSIRQMREAIKDRERQIRELKAKIPVEAAPEVKADPRPELKDYQWDEAAHGDAVVEWASREATRKAEAKAQQDKAQAVQQQFEEKQTKARAAGKALASDFDNVETAVKDTLSPNQVALIYHAIPGAEQMIYAIGRNPKLMAELAAETDLALFTRRVAQLEGKIKVERKAPPAPEARIVGGGSASSTVSQSRIDAAEKMAEKTGDRSEVIRLKRLLKG